MRLTLSIAAGALLIAGCGSNVSITSTPIPAVAGKLANFDVIEIDQSSHRMYVSDRTDQGVDVFDVSGSRARFLATIPLTSSPNGLAVAPDLARLYVGTGSGSVLVIDTSNDSNAVVAEVKTGKGEVDLLDYGASRQRLYAANGADGSITSIDTNTNTIAANFKLGAVALEQPRFDPGDGMVYVASPTAASLFQIDPNNGQVKSFPLGGCKPRGLAINPKSNQAVIVCSTFVMTWDLKAARSIASYHQVVGGDVVTYSAKVDRFFVASPHTTQANVVAIFGGDPIDYIASIGTGAHGNAAALDETHGVVYTPNPQPKRSGIAGFDLAATPQPAPRWLQQVATVGVPVGLLAVFVLLFFFVIRSADPARRVEKAAPKVEGA
jgi:DNA-binding beta-propeller fold protein YncE